MSVSESQASKPSAPIEALGAEQPSALAQALIKVLSLAVDRVLSLDPQMRGKLQALEGRAVSVSLKTPPVRLIARVQAQALVFTVPSQAEVADLSLSTELGALVQLGLQRLSGSAELGIGKMHISGDAELARQMQALMQQFEPDWDAPLLAVFGDVIGFQLARGARTVVNFLKTGARNLAESGSEFLREESRDVVSAPELEQFYDDVDALRDRLARAELRLNNLSKTRV